MNLTKIAIKRDRVTFALMVVVIIMGITTYGNLSRDDMPPYTVRVATIVSDFPGANPERIEQLVSKILKRPFRNCRKLKGHQPIANRIVCGDRHVKDEVKPKSCRMYGTA